MSQLTCADFALTPAQFDAEDPGEPGLPPHPDPPSEILADRLWIGGVPTDFRWVRAHDIDVVVDLADADSHPDPSDLEGLAYLKHPFVDDGSMPDIVVLDGVVATVSEALRAGRRVLVHCTWGRNRSGLVTALVVRDVLGVDGATATRLVRERRRRALNNEQFVAHVCGLDATA